MQHEMASVQQLADCQSLQEFADTLAVSHLTVYRLAEAGKIKTIYIGARRVVPPQEVQRILAEGVPKPRSRRAKKPEVEGVKSRSRAAARKETGAR